MSLAIVRCRIRNKEHDLEVRKTKEVTRVFIEILGAQASAAQIVGGDKGGVPEPTV